MTLLKTYPVFLHSVLSILDTSQNIVEINCKIVAVVGYVGSPLYDWFTYITR